ncbi:translation machinery-associated protein 16 [Clohesyomyces aquaticus]|uniref:Translation machinery-associated protein 16 n=1 Tax=Clohesyomyces aquaticus TaxID=1231657 RepID=A0A1Y1Y8Y4_9PLEO|nr:translation machinery-associated protein 16 [Clohesyomyces aquaticus]
MPSNRLGKVQKHIQKKKGRNVALHENSRDTKRLQSAAGRDDKLNRLASVREKQNRPYLIRVKFFQTAAAEHITSFSLSDIQNVINTYLHRDDEELASLKADRRAGRPPSTRETLLKQHQATEQNEYESGIWLPDMEDGENLKFLSEWNGKWTSLSTLKFVRISEEGVKRQSSFPPKGMS